MADAMTDETQGESGERMVGCETDDGLIITHPERLYCEVCRFHGDEAQGIEVVAEGYAEAPVLLPSVWPKEVWVDGANSTDIPVLLVRDTPEAREALGMDEND